MLGVWLLSTLIVVLIVRVLFHTSQAQPISKDYIFFGIFITHLFIPIVYCFFARLLR